MSETLKDNPNMPQGFPWQMDEYGYSISPASEVLAVQVMESSEDQELHDALDCQMTTTLDGLSGKNQGSVTSDVARVYEEMSEKFAGNGFLLKSALLKSRAAEIFAQFGKLGTAERLYIEAIGLDRKAFELTDGTWLTRARFPNANVEAGEVRNQDAKVTPTNNLTIYAMINRHYYKLLGIIHERNGSAASLALRSVVKQRGVYDLYRTDASAAYDMKDVWFDPMNPFTKKKY